jgi:hypothetical protein
MKRDIVEPALAMHGDARQSLDRLRLELAIFDHAKAPGLLGHEHAPVGKERERPGLLQAFHHAHDAKRVLI